MGRWNGRMDNMIGKVLDNRYELLDVIGTGGMAVVYKAQDRRLNRSVAVPHMFPVFDGAFVFFSDHEKTPFMLWVYEMIIYHIPSFSNRNDCVDAGD